MPSSFIPKSRLVISESQEKTVSLLVLSYIMLKNGQTYFKNLAV